MVSDMVNWKLKGCPHCGGDICISVDDDGWYEWCLQCGYEGDLPDGFVLDQAAGEREKHRLSRVLRDLPNIPARDYQT